MARVIGVDLGAHTVKVAVFKGSFGRYAVTDFLLRRVASPDSTGSGASLSQRLAVLAELLADARLEDLRSVAMAWPAERSSMRLVHLPFVDRNQVARTIPFEVETSVPFELEDMILDHRVVKTIDDGSQVLAVLVRREDLSGFLEQVGGADLSPRNLGIDGDLMSAYTQEGVQVVLDLGHERTVVSLAVDGQVLGVRGLDTGGRFLSERLAGAFGLEPDVAEGYKHALSLKSRQALDVTAEWEDETETSMPDDHLEHFIDQSHDTDAMARVLGEAAAELLSEIRASLIAFEDNIGVEIAEILICGGTAELDGLAELLARDLGLPVRAIAIDAAAERFADSGRFALAHALGMRAAGELRGRPLELRKGEFAYHGHMETLKTLLSYGAMGAALFVVAGLVIFFMDHAKYSEQVDSLSANIANVVNETFPDVERSRLDDPGMAVAIMQEKAMAVTERVALLGAAIRGQPPTLTLLKSLSEGMPPPSEATIDIKELTLSETAVNLKAETAGYEEAARIEASLQNVQRFKTANKGDEKKMGDKVQFSLSIPLGGSEAVAGEERG